MLAFHTGWQSPKWPAMQAIGYEQTAHKSTKRELRGYNQSRYKWAGREIQATISHRDKQSERKLRATSYKLPEVIG